MSVWIHHVETAVPERCYGQEDVGKHMLEWTTDERDKRLVRMLYRNSGIETRHSVIPDWGEGFFIAKEDGSYRQPSTSERNSTYTREGHRLAVDLG
ncbi:MAG: hypothetical protein OES29_12395, partial [Desulfuromonadales bacterium]|nr:hypothetical protein [Desulfuromonadales bacterium]